MGTINSSYYDLKKRGLFYLIGVLFFASCTFNSENSTEEKDATKILPQIVALNTNEGYIINPLTGDSIEPLLNNWGDTIKTGVLISVTGKVILSDSVLRPKILKLEEFKKTYTSFNAPKILENLTVIPIDRNSLKSYPINTKHSSFELLGVDGKVISSGVPLLIKGKVVVANQPKPITALPPVFKEKAIYDIQCLGIDQGMSSSSIFNILQGNNGEVWITTSLSGISKYDGEKFTHYTTEEGLSNDRILAGIRDRKGNFWFGTNGGGISKYDGEKFIHFTEKEGFIDNTVVSILEDKKGNIWFGTNGSGVSKYDGKKFTHFTTKEGLSNNVILSIIEDKKGDIWFGTEGGGASVFDGTAFIQYTTKEGLSNDNVVSMAEDQAGNIWLGTYGGGVSKYNGESFTHYTTKEGLADNYIWSILEDSKGIIWFGTVNGGVSRYDGKSFKTISVEEGLSDKYVKTVFEDLEGSLWFGTEGGGISIYKEGGFVHYTKENGVNNFILAITETKDQEIWMGVYSEGLLKYDDTTITNYTENEGSMNSITAMYEDSKKNIWIGTKGKGVLRFDGKNLTQYRVEEGLTGNTVWAICEDKKGHLWFGTNKGITKYELSEDGETENFVHFTDSEGLITNGVRAIYEDKEENIWIATKVGIVKYDGHQFIYITEKEGLSSNNVRSIIEDKKGNIWIGTGDAGISMYDGENFTNYTKKEGLTDNFVMSVNEDRKGRIWVSTTKGINHLVYRNNKAVISTFEKKEGLKGVLVLRGEAVCLDSKNRMWWGNEKCLTMLDLNKYEESQNAPIVTLSSIDINGKHIDYRALQKDEKKEFQYDSVPLYFNYPLGLELKHSNNYLTFHYSAIEWSAPHKIKYSYKLEGINDTWSLPTEESKVDYRSLPYGEYTFNVKAIGASQTWSEPFEYRFIIHPPWWFTWWAYSIYGLLLIFAVFLLIQSRTKALKQRQKELEAEITAATVEIQSQNDKLIEMDGFKEGMTSMIVHDLKNPLNAIVNTEQNEDKDDQIKSMKQSGQMMLNMVMDILDVSKYENSKMTLSLGSRSIGEVAINTKSYVQFLAVRKAISIVIDVPLSLSVYADGEILERIIVNLLTNAIKYSPIKGEIRINAQEVGSEMVKISVLDAGSGIASDVIHKVFDRFGQVAARKSGSVRSTGLGLTFCKMATEAHGGEIGVESEVEKGTTFWFTLRKSDMEGIPVKIQNEEKEISDYQLSPEDVIYLGAFAEKLKAIPIYNISAIRTIMNEIEVEKESSVACWKKDLLIVVNTGNEEEYMILLNFNKTDEKRS